MTISIRALRNITDALGLTFGAATFATALSAVCIAGYWERIISGYSAELICGTTFGAVCVAYYISSLSVTAAKPQSRFTSLLVSAIARELLVALGAALAGYQSSVFAGVRECRAYRRSNIDGNPGPAANCNLPLAAGILAWITVGVIAIGVMVEIAVVTSRYGHNKRTWRSSIAALELGAERREDTASLNPPKV